MMRPESVRASSREYAALLAKALPPETIAEILIGLVGIDADPRCTDREVAVGGWLFDRLTEACPDAVTLAAGGGE